MYKIGVLSAFDEQVNSDGDDDAVNNAYAITFDAFQGGVFDYSNNIKIDSKGRIIYLQFHIGEMWNIDRIDIPPIIERLTKLEHLDLRNSNIQSIPIELGNLPLLERMTFCDCSQALFRNISSLRGGMMLQLRHVKKVELYDSRFGSFLSPFLKIFRNDNNDNDNNKNKNKNNSSLEELSIHSVMSRKEIDELLLCTLQNDDDCSCFRQSLTTIDMSSCMINEDDLGRLLFDILPRFPNLHTLDVTNALIDDADALCQGIESLRGIEDRINKLQRHNVSSPSSSSLPSSLPSSSSSSSRGAVIPDHNLRYLDF